MASNVYQPSLTGTASSNSQAINLNIFLTNSSIDDAVAVSFSMGAMNTRRYLRNQYELLIPGRFTHHYSIGGTHYGSPVATNLEMAVRIAVAGAAAAIYPGDPWIRDESFPPKVKSEMQGICHNDLFVVGASGLISHWNGATWYHFAGTDLPYFNGSLASVDYKGDLAVAVGFSSWSSIILKGWRIKEE